MPEIGEIRKASEIGKRSGNGDRGKFIRAACIDCGKERWVEFIKKTEKLKSLRCRSCAQGERRQTSRGGRIKKPDGYIAIRLQPDDFFYPMARRDGYVAEHRLVMAKHLGRCLHRWEIVHHKGIRCKGMENRSDNLRDNLQLVSDIQHKGITYLEQEIKYLKARVTLLEAENVLLKATLKEEDHSY